jgi:hypothetical protein
MNRPTAITMLALFALLGCLGWAGAAICPPSEGLHGCHTTDRLGAPIVCEGNEAEAEPTDAAPAPATPEVPPLEAVPLRRFCYSAERWGPAAAGKRPCVRVARLYEDGSARLVQEPANGAYRVVCTLQNPREVRRGGTYRTSCRRLY